MWLCRLMPYTHTWPHSPLPNTLKWNWNPFSDGYTVPRETWPLKYICVHEITWHWVERVFRNFFRFVVQAWECSFRIGNSSLRGSELQNNNASSSTDLHASLPLSPLPSTLKWNWKPLSDGYRVSREMWPFKYGCALEIGWPWDERALRNCFVAIPSFLIKFFRELTFLLGVGTPCVYISRKKYHHCLMPTFIIWCQLYHGHIDHHLPVERGHLHQVGVGVVVNLEAVSAASA